VILLQLVRVRGQGRGRLVLETVCPPGGKCSEIGDGRLLQRRIARTPAPPGVGWDELFRRLRYRFDYRAGGGFAGGSNVPTGCCFGLPGAAPGRSNFSCAQNCEDFCTTRDCCSTELAPGRERASPPNQIRPLPGRKNELPFAGFDCVDRKRSGFSHRPPFFISRRCPASPQRRHLPGRAGPTADLSGGWRASLAIGLVGLPRSFPGRGQGGFFPRRGSARLPRKKTALKPGPLSSGASMGAYGSGPLGPRW